MNKIPIFYFNPKEKESSFLDALEISPKGITLCQDSYIPQQSGTIEFSFPYTEKVVKADYEKEHDFFLKFKNISQENKNLILKENLKQQLFQEIISEIEQNPEQYGLRTKLIQELEQNNLTEIINVGECFCENGKDCSFCKALIIENNHAIWEIKDGKIRKI